MTFCPSEVAREIQPDDWRGLMGEVREVAQELVDEQKLDCTQAGRGISPLAAKGPIRLALAVSLRAPS
ncbi:MAG: DUF3253 domain-containing protein [Verrucomicrobiota bacterium]|nr:DUF3253 domain-containing protein [Verrucomicrobiota bacterium]